MESNKEVNYDSIIQKGKNLFQDYLNRLEISSDGVSRCLYMYLESIRFCGIEQRKFLDEIESNYIYLDEEDLIKPKNSGFDSRIWQDETESDLIKVIEGE
jgi:hypothetical protein